MNVVLSHLTLNFLGGEEKLCLSIIKALKLNGNRVTLFTVEKTDWGSVRKFFGNFVKPNEEIYSAPLTISANLKTSTLALAYANYLAGLIKFTFKRKYDLVINTYGDLINSVADLSYVHFPLRATLDYSQTPVFTSLIKWKAYCQAYNLASLILDNIKPGVLLTNSKFTQQVVKKYLKRDAFVLHPPVDVQAYASKEVKRQNCAITVSRFTPKRALYRVPLIAKNAKAAKFIIAGKADKHSFKTIQDLKEIIKRCGVEDRVVLLPNVSHSTLIELLTRAKVYLHVMPFEHFGISIIEAMAAGCVPVVHRSGGPWLDILDQQQTKYGFSYANVEEAAQFVELLIGNEDMRKEISSAAQKRSWNYDKSIFEKKLIDIVNRIASSVVGNSGG